MNIENRSSSNELNISSNQNLERRTGRYTLAELTNILNNDNTFTKFKKETRTYDDIISKICWEKRNEITQIILNEHEKTNFYLISKSQTVLRNLKSKSFKI